MEKEIDLKEVNKKIWNFIEKNRYFIFFCAITIISILVRRKLMYFITADFRNFIIPWFNEIKEYGGFAALNREIGNYNMPYRTVLAILTYLEVEPLTSVKIFSIVFDYISAMSAMKIVEILLKDNKNKKLYAVLTYSIVLFLPTVITNSAFWGQADSIYAAFIFLALRYAVEDKYFRAFIFLGISFAFKLQFMFILPLFIFMYITERKFPLYYFLIIPLMDIILCLPAIIAGQPVVNIIKIYAGQTETMSNSISLNFPGIWSLLLPVDGSNLVKLPSENISSAGVYVTLFIFAIMAFLIFNKKMKFNGKKMIEFGLWSVMIATFFLPNMHDRYLFVGDILSVLYFICNKDKFYVPIIVNLVSAYSYATYLFGTNQIQIQYVSIMYMVLIILVTKDLYQKYLSGGEIANEEVVVSKIESKGIKDVRKNKQNK